MKKKKKEEAKDPNATNFIFFFYFSKFFFKFNNSSWVLGVTELICTQWCKELHKYLLKVTDFHSKWVRFRQKQTLSQHPPGVRAAWGPVPGSSTTVPCKAPSAQHQQRAQLGYLVCSLLSSSQQEICGITKYVVHSNFQHLYTSSRIGLNPCFLFSLHRLLSQALNTQTCTFLIQSIRVLFKKGKLNRRVQNKTQTISGGLSQVCSETSSFNGSRPGLGAGDVCDMARHGTAWHSSAQLGTASSLCSPCSAKGWQPSG